MRFVSPRFKSTAVKWCDVAVFLRLFRGLSTTRAFTAREDFAAPVIIETAQGRTEHAFRDDHFARLLDYVAKSISSGYFTLEYEECLNQARILQDVRKEAWA